uniref:RRM domain-containing protein n=1 Tax=Medicago truncatula TaxID=3880 RepID=I3T0M9_MEDTR|nr:unknown [Medicago truncatula]
MADVEYRCFVGGLAWATDNEALEKAFSQYGEIVDSKVRLLLAGFGSDLTRF